MSDIRKKVVEDRGLIKRFQAFLPGYKKYRNTEDLRIADDILRRELAKELEIIEGHIKDGREEATRTMDMELINAIADLVNYSHRVTEKVRHAQQGYAPWISSDVRIEENELNALYDHDLLMFRFVERIKGVSSTMRDQFRSGDPARKATARDLKEVLRDFESAFDSRISKVSNVAQKK